MANPYGGADSVCDLLHVQVAAAAGERVPVGAGTVSWRAARQLSRRLLVDVAKGTVNENYWALNLRKKR